MIIEKVFVMGSGIMGSGIAQVTAEAGYSVILMDVKEELTNKSVAGIEKRLDRKIEKGESKENDKKSVMSRIKTSIDIQDSRDADLVIEAIPEVIDLKINAFRELDNICQKNAILASNTSTIPISNFGAATKRQPNVIGIHFMNPVPIMKGVEIIPTRYTSDETTKLSIDFIKSLGKEPCQAKDYAGFIVSRLVDALINEAVHCVRDGNLPEEIDKAMRLCCNFPIGPLELCDLSGADIVLHGMETMHAEFGERFQPAPILSSMVRSGDLGRKTGRGFYEYKKM